MRSFYGVLGVRPEASLDEIKAAFRKLAKQYHPDLHAGDKRAEARFKEVNEVHAILSDPGARAQYDASLSQRRLLRWLGARRAVAIMAVSFGLTVTVISTAIVVQQDGSGWSLFSAGRQETEAPATARRREAIISEAVDGRGAVGLPGTDLAVETDAAPRGPLVEAGRVEPRSHAFKDATAAGPKFGSDTRVQETDRAAITAVEVQREPKVPDRLHLPDAGKTPDKETPAIEPGTQEVDHRAGKRPAAMPRQLRADSANWASYRNARFGFSLRYPADIFALEPGLSDELVKHFRSRDGRATLRIVATPNVAGRTPAQYRSALIQERYGKAKFDYAPQRDTWFVLSGFAGDDIFYERVTFACDKRSLHGWALVFPSSERLLYEPIIEEVHRNYRHSNGPRARCGGKKAQLSAGSKSDRAATGGSL